MPLIKKFNKQFSATNLLINEKFLKKDISCLKYLFISFFLYLNIFEPTLINISKYAFVTFCNSMISSGKVLRGEVP